MDGQLCFKSRTAVLRLLASREVFLLFNDQGREWGIQFVDLRPVVTFSGKLASALAVAKCVLVPGLIGPADYESFAPAAEGNSDGAITDVESQANAGIAPDTWDTRFGEMLPDANQIQRAREKTAAWPHCEDDKNPLVHGSWPSQPVAAEA